MLQSRSPLLQPSTNPVLHALLKHTFYAQFCAGETAAEVQRTLAALQRTGYSGVILEFALEVLGSAAPTAAIPAAQTAAEVAAWRAGALASVAATREGDYVGLKWSGLGAEALRRLGRGDAPAPAMDAAIAEVCDAAARRGVRLLPGAEMRWMNAGIDAWTLDAMRRCNRGGRVVVFNTYQAYLRCTPEKLARHLCVARDEGWALGAKVVRGAYLAAEARESVWASKDETDRCYDGLVEALLRRRWNGALKAPDGEEDARFPDVSLVIASHNLPSVRKAMAIRNMQARTGEERIDCAYAQLYGMADDVSAELVAASKAAVHEEVKGESVDRPIALKCATWGTLDECLNFLLRRAAENKDAAGRTADTRKAMAKELGRRFRALVGLA